MKSNNVLSMCDFKFKKETGGFNIYSMNEFISIMSGEGFDDSAFEIHVSPFKSSITSELEGWYISFYHASKSNVGIVANGKDKNDFILDYRPIDEIVDILATLPKCNRYARLNFECLG